MSELERKRALKGIRRLVAGQPELARRTEQFLSGELPVRGMQKQIAVRVPDPLIERLEALKAALEADSHYAVRGPWNTSAVLREVIIRGVAALEEELGETN